LWDKYYRKSWGPITRPLYLSVDPTDSAMTKLAG
jgi:hypothetical protein